MYIINFFSLPFGRVYNSAISFWLLELLGKINISLFFVDKILTSINALLPFN